MYTVTVKRDFVAQHFLVGGDWGSENQWHSHHYQVEIQLQGATLDKHGYLVDIVDIETNLEALVAHFQDKTLNETSEFSGLNPSIEHFARILCQGYVNISQAHCIDVSARDLLLGEFKRLAEEREAA